MCAQGRYTEAPGQSACQACETGTYASSEGSYACTECLAGSYIGATGATVCDLCASGAYQDLGGQSDCISCEPGTVSTLPGSVECSSCEKGSFQPITGQKQCILCPKGQHQDVIGSVNCTNCSTGMYTGSDGSISCHMCESGKYQALSGQSVCGNCAYGTYKAASGVEPCTLCEPGKYTSAATTLFSCASCASGRSQPHNGSTFCVECDLGQAQSQVGAVDCSYCPIGTYSGLLGSVVCVECEAGKQQPLAGQEECNNCEFGRYKAQTGSEMCSDCVEGSYTSEETTLLTCAPCSIGRYQDKVGEFTCPLCALGKFQDHIGSSRCSNCSAGAYTSSEGSFTCTQCLEGSYQQSTGQTECDVCPEGKFQDETGQMGCLNCTPGRFSGSAGVSKCKICPFGTIQSRYGQPSCETCPAGRHMDTLGSSASECELCQPGFIANQGSMVCEECKSSVDFQPEMGQQTCVGCPVHSSAANYHSTCMCDAQYYAIPYGDYLLFSEMDPEGYDIYNSIFILGERSESSDDDVIFDANEYLKFWCVECPEGADCMQSGTVLENVSASEGFFLGLDGSGTTFIPCLNSACGIDGNCSHGYTGPSCTECDGEGLVLDDFKCIQCPETWKTVFIMLGGVVAFTLFLMDKLNDAKQGYLAHNVFLKIVVSSFQINALALSYAFDWGELMAGYLNVQSQVSSLGTAYFEVQCFSTTAQGNGFLANSILYLLGPPGMALFIFAFCFIYRYVKNRHLPNVWETARHKSLNTATSAAVLIVFLLQPDLVERGALVFSCVRMGGGSSDLFMTEDLSVQCWSSTHWFYISTLGAGFLLVYIIGVPVGLYLLLSHKRNLPLVRAIISGNISEEGE